MKLSFDDYFQPLALIGNIFGVIYFCPETKRGTKQCLLYLRSVPFATLFIITSTIALKLQYGADYSHHSRIKKIGVVLPLGVCSILTLIKFIFYVVKRKDYQKLIDDITKLGTRCALPKQRCNNWIKIIIWFSSLMSYFTVESLISGFGMGLAYTFTYGFGIYVSIYESICMSSIIKELESIFQYINKKLEQPPQFLEITKKLDAIKQKLSTPDLMNNENQLRTRKACDKNMFLEHIYDLIELHFEATNLCHRMNRIFTYPLLGLLLMGFAFVVNCGEMFLFNIFATHHIKEFDFDAYDTWMHAYWSILELNHLFFTIRPWAQLTEESVKTSTHIHEIWNNLAVNHEIDVNSSHLQLIAVQLLNRKLKFTANGLFPINLGLFQMIIAAVSTYIVILIQFDMSAMKKIMRKITIEN